VKLGRTVVVTAAATLSLALPAGAWACNYPEAQSDGGDPPGGTGPGETVYFLLSNVDETATFEVAHEGEYATSGEVKAQGSGSRYRATFPMPNLGSQDDTVTFDVKIDHPIHGSWPKSFTVKYRGTATSPEPSPQDREPSSTPRPQPSPKPVEAPSENLPNGAGGSVPAGGTGGVSPTGPGGLGGGPTTPSSPLGPPGGPSDVGSEALVENAEPIAARVDQAVAPATRATLSDRATDGARRPVVRAVAADPADAADGSGGIVLILAALTMAGVGAALAVRRRRGGSGPAAEPAPPLVPNDPAVEAELQEIISEERARLDREHGERSPAELAAARDDPG
jgi:MYXO-CTERM domain-containing protein